MIRSLSRALVFKLIDWLSILYVNLSLTPIRMRISIYEDTILTPKEWAEIDRQEDDDAITELLNDSADDDSTPYETSPMTHTYRTAQAIAWLDRIYMNSPNSPEV